MERKKATLNSYTCFIYMAALTHTTTTIKAVEQKSHKKLGVLKLVAATTHSVLFNWWYETDAVKVVAASLVWSETF